MNLFGKAKPKTTPKDAIIHLRETLGGLEKRERFLQSKVDNELAIAKQNATKNKKAALMALKRKKQYESEIAKISGMMMNMETQILALESSTINLEVMNSIKQGAESLKAAHGAMDINKVDDTMEQIREQMDTAQEISDAISQPLGGMGVDIDDDELLEELNQFEQEELDSKLLDAEKPSTVLPSVPSTSVPRPVKQQPVAAAVTEDEDKELEELKASMAL